MASVMGSRSVEWFGRRSLRACGCLLLSWLLTSPVQAAAAEPATLVLLIRENRNESGDMQSLRPEVRHLLDYFERRLQIRFDIRRYPYPRLIDNVRQGEGLAFGLSKGKRLSDLVFSDVFYANYVWLVVRSDAVFPFDSVADLQGKTIGITRGSSYGDEFEAQRQVKFNVEEDVSSDIPRLKKLMSRRMDAMLFGDFHERADEVAAYLHQVTARDMVRADGNQPDFTVLPKPLLVDELCFAAAPGRYDLWIRKLNGVIRSGKKNGDIARIMNAGRK